MLTWLVLKILIKLALGLRQNCRYSFYNPPFLVGKIAFHYYSLSVASVHTYSIVVQLSMRFPHYMDHRIEELATVDSPVRA